MIIVIDGHSTKSKFYLKNTGLTSTIEMIAKAILSKERSNSKGGQHEGFIDPRA
jgi:hypothetical protein